MKSVFYRLISQLSFALILICCAFTLAQDNSNTLFTQANELYNQGQFELAIKKYERILQNNQHSAEVYFNLANSHYKLNRIAPSIYYYEKALLLNPDDQEIKNNLAFAQNMTIDDIADVPQVGFSKLYKNWVNTYSFDTWSKLAVAFSTLLVILFLIYYFSHSTGKKRLAFVLGFVCLTATAVTLFMAFLKFDFDQQDIAAIIFDKSIDVKSEPNLESTNLFKLHEGAKIKVLDSVSNWQRIELPDGLSGWVPSQAIKVL